MLRHVISGWRSVGDRWLAADALAPWTQRAVLWSILLGCLAVRLYTIGAPALDRTDWKEIDHIEIARNFQRHGFDLLSPEITWPAEEPRVVAMELPLAPYAASALSQVMGVNPVSVRLVPLLSYLVITWYVFRLARRELGPLVGLTSALAAAIMPLYHPFGKFLFSEPPMVALSVMAVDHFAAWVDGRRLRDWLIAAAAFSLAVALKLEPLYLLLPLLWPVWRKYRFGLVQYGGYLWLMVFAAPLATAWYAHAYHVAVEYGDQWGVFFGHNRLQTAAMLADPEWYAVMGQRLYWQILGGLPGLALAAIGVAAAISWRRGGLLFAYLVAIASHFLIVAEGHRDAAYRQLPAIPVLATFIGLGSVALAAAAWSLFSWAPRRSEQQISDSRGSDPKTALKRGFGGGIVLTASLAAVAVIGFQRRSEILAHDATAPVHRDKWAMAEIVRAHTRPGTRLVAAGEYTVHVRGNDLSPTLFYYSGLRGWSLQPPHLTVEAVRELSGRGGTLFAAVHPEREAGVAALVEQLVSAGYPVLHQSDSFVLLELRKPLVAER